MGLFLEVQNQGSRFKGVKIGSSRQWKENQGRYSNMSISYKIRILIYGVSGHSIDQGNQKCLGARMGVNKVFMKNTARWNKEHMEAGLERNKKWDFTINDIQGWELITTKFNHGNLVPGISEVMWRWQRWWNLEWARTCQQLFVSVTGCNNWSA